METKHLIMERGGEQQEKSPTYLPGASKQCRSFLAWSILGSDYNKKMPVKLKWKNILDFAIELGYHLTGEFSNWKLTCKNSLGTTGNGNRKQNKIITWFGNLGFGSKAWELVRECWLSEGPPSLVAMQEPASGNPQRRLGVSERVLNSWLQLQTTRRLKSLSLLMSSHLQDS